MAKDCSFDVVSEFDRQELVNAIDQVKRDVASRFDLKDSGSTVELEADKMISCFCRSVCVLPVVLAT